MKSNLHTHTTYCDGKNSPEEIVLAAIGKGFSSIGFSGHGYTDFDLRYCIKDVEGYKKEITSLKEKYKGEIEVYLGVEEDMYCQVKRSDYDYVIGSSHYCFVNGEYYPIDSSPAHFGKCLDAFNYDVERMAEDYYGRFCKYINTRKPDIVGHFDLITKFDETDDARFLPCEEYHAIAERWLLRALPCGALFEVNTGAIARSLRTSPYPHERLLRLLQKNGAGVVLSSDSHQKETLDFAFDEARRLLRSVGFCRVYALSDGKFREFPL